MSIIREHLTQPRETSIYLPNGDSTSPAHNYKKLSKSLEHGHGLANAAGNTSRALAANATDTAVDYGFHPYKVYRLPAFVRDWVQSFTPGVPYDWSTDWLTFRVRHGTLRYGATVWPDGTDFYMGTSTPEDDLLALQFSYRESFVTCTDLTVVNGADFIIDIIPEGQIGWFWLEFTSPTTAEIRQTSDVSFDAWDGYPNQTAYVIPIAKLDMDSYHQTGETVVNVSQVLTTDYVMPTEPVGNYTGAWSNTFAPFHAQGYPMGAVVTKESVNVAGMTNTWRSPIYFNKTDPDSGGNWTLLGQYPTVNP